MKRTAQPLRLSSGNSAVSASQSRRLHYLCPSRLGRRLGVLPLVYTLATGAAFTYHDNSNLMGRKLGLRVRQPHGLATDVGAAGFFGLEARGNGSEDVFMYVSEKMHLPPYSSLLRNALPRAFLSGAADLPERGRQDLIFWAGDAGTAAHTHYDPTHTVFVQVSRG